MKSGTDFISKHRSHPPSVVMTILTIQKKSFGITTKPALLIHKTEKWLKKYYYSMQETKLALKCLQLYNNMLLDVDDSTLCVKIHCSCFSCNKLCIHSLNKDLSNSPDHFFFFLACFFSSLRCLSRSFFCLSA